MRAVISFLIIGAGCCFILGVLNALQTMLNYKEKSFRRIKMMLVELVVVSAMYIVLYMIIRTGALDSIYYTSGFTNIVDCVVAASEVVCVIGCAVSAITYSIRK